MNKFMKKLMKKDGFTLVELIVVIAILAILAGVAIPAYSGYITKAQDAAVITELDAIATAAQAANASAGEIVKIEVTKNTTDSTKTDVVVYFKSTTGDDNKVVYNRSDKFGSDFVLYYGGVANNPSTTDGTVTITISKEILDGSYATRATWLNGKWSENCDHSLTGSNGKHTCSKCDFEDNCVYDAETDKCVCGAEKPAQNG